MERKLKRTGIIILTLSMVLSTFSMCFATAEAYEGEEELLENLLLPVDTIEDDYLATRGAHITGVGAVDFTKTSSTKATATIKFRCSEEAKSLTSTITLQVYSSSSGSYVNTSAAPAVQTVKDTISIGQQAVFKIAEGKKYRIKIVIKVVTDKETMVETFYRNML